MGNVFKTVVNAKGQVVIPANLRRRLGIKKGNRVYVEERDGEIILQPLNRDYFQKVSGILKGSKLLKALKEGKRDNLRLEERKWYRC